MEKPVDLEATPARQKFRILVRNQRENPVTFILEPSGADYPMPPGAVFEIRAEGPEGDHPEICFETEAIIVWAWAGSIAEVYHDEVPLSPGPPIPVPTALPEGMTVRGFLGMILGQDQPQKPE
jgi:hypothetical protein